MTNPSDSEKPETVTVPLSKPLTFGDGDQKKIWKELTFREATVADLIAAEKLADGEIGLSAATLAIVAGVPFPIFVKLPARDMRAILAKAGHLLGN